MDNHVRERREARDLTQGGLAAVVGVTRQTINNVERGRYDPSLELAFALADAFDCRVDDLFEPEGEGNEDGTGGADG